MKTLFSILKWGIISFFALSVLGVLYYKWMPVRFTPLMGIRCVQQIMNGEKPKISHQWVSLEEISIYMPVAVIASEDQNFMRHHGFDAQAIAQAISEHEQGKRARGASTISQQTAKNVFLWPTSSWVRKGFEAYFTVLIELLWTKERIMEVYLNSIEMGRGIYGVEAVACEHFSCTAGNLRRQDCALIAATLPNPMKFSSAIPSAYMRKRQRWIMNQMRHVPVLSRNNK